MALDAYLQLGDIKGDSTDDKHKGWIEALAAVPRVVGTQPRTRSTPSRGPRCRTPFFIQAT